MERIKAWLSESAALKSTLAQDQRFIAAVLKASEMMVSAVKKGGTIYACGNGGSACDSMHLCEELVARFKRNRPGIKAMHFLDPSTVSCWANDFDYNSVFKRQVETFCSPDDLLFVFSTSGNSVNILEAVAAAKALGTASVGLTGKDGGRLKDLCDVPMIVPSVETARIQECHITVVHMLCEIVETELFK